MSSKSLQVYRGEVLVGELDMAPNEPFYGFTYDTGYLSRHDARSLSLSLPLRAERFSGARAMPYFEGLLPEGNVRDSIARQLHISPNSPAQLIRALGNDCAGDVAVFDPEDAPQEPQAKCRYHALPQGLEPLASHPLQETTNLRLQYRLSLAGGQEKVALYHDADCSWGEGWYAPLFGSPSSHIVKPQYDVRFPGLVLNEFLCMQTAQNLGLDVAQTRLLPMENTLLLVERYDRVRTEETDSAGLAVLQRVHQEDFCQALGKCSEEKYEAGSSNQEDTHFAQMASLILRECAEPVDSLKKLFELAVFNYLIGNCDAHLKNYSLLEPAGGRVKLAPAYDLISTTVYDGEYGSALNRSMGMRMGEHQNIDKVTAADVLALAKNLHQPVGVVRDCIERIVAGFEPALESVMSAACEQGCAQADGVASRILDSASSRVGVLRQV